MRFAAVAFALAVLAVPSAALAQADEVTQVDEIVVLAQRSGAPIWTVRRGGATLVLVGSISGMPADVTWRPDALEAAVGEADLVLTSQEGRVGVMDILRIVWRMRTIGRLPDDRTTGDYLSADWQARLDALMAAERNDGWRRQSLLTLGFDLMQERAGFGQGRQGESAAVVVRRAAREADIENRPVGTVRGDDMVESLISALQETYVPCVEAAIAAAERGLESARARAMDWRARRVAAVVASPIDRALARCWPWADAEIAGVLHQQWADTIDTALTADQVTLAVAPLRLLAEPDGILDQLEARGLDVEGPVWRAAPGA